MFRGMKLYRKEVIDIATAEKIGIISDVEINEKTGNIDALIVPQRGKFLSRLWGGGELVIPWDNVVVMGKEIILVHMSTKNNAETYFPYT